MAHYSHKLQMVGDVVVCEVCGYYASGELSARDLRWPCAGKEAPRARLNFARLAEGLLPKTCEELREIDEDTLLSMLCITV